MKPLIAIVGRPNVGKSQLFNRLAGQRIAVVADMPGTTRDRLYAPCDIWGRACVVIDTGGLELQEKEGYSPAILSQAQLAIDDADIIIFVTDAREEPTTMDFEVAEKLRQTQKPVILVGNKVDNPKMPLSNLYALRLGDPLPISGLTGHNVGDLADKIDDYLRDNDIAGEEQEKNLSTKIALVGRPNVGKSSITNTLLGYERTIVSPIPGTTRDAIDTRIDWKGNDVTLIDTAGMRRRSRVKRDETSLEYHMVLRSLRAVERGETTVLVLDAGGVTDQDTKIAGYAHEAGKAILIAVNKWDIIEGERDKKTLAQKDYEAQIARYLPFISYAPIHFISAQTGAGVQDMFDDALSVSQSLKERVATGPLNDILQRAMADHPPPSPKGRSIKIRYATQVDTMPPTILLFCNRPDIVHFSYVRFLENQIRARFPFRGVSLRMELRGGSGATGREERLQAKRETALDEDAERMRQKRAARQGSRAIEQVPATEVPKTTGPKKSARRGAQRFEKSNPNGLTSREIQARAPKRAPRQPAKPTPKRRDQQG